MPNSQSQEIVTIKVAAKALNVNRRTIYRWINKGLISKVEDNKKTFVPIDDIRALRNKSNNKMPQRQNHHVSQNYSSCDTVTLGMEHYESMLIRLGQLEHEKTLFLEYKGDLEKKEKEFEETKSQLIETTLWLEEAEKENKKIALQKYAAKIQKKEIENLKRNLHELNRQLSKLKKRGLLERIFNKF
ncbi:MAG: helix-turn-helix domain-containing protein [bacterium]